MSFWSSGWGIFLPPPWCPKWALFILWNPSGGLILAHQGRGGHVWWWHILRETGVFYNLSDWEQYKFSKGHTIGIRAKQRKLLHMMKQSLGDGCGAETKCNTCFVSIECRQHSMLESDYELTADGHAWCGLLDGAYNDRHWCYLVGLIKACLLFTGLKPGL